MGGYGHICELLSVTVFLIDRAADSVCHVRFKGNLFYQNCSNAENNNHMTMIVNKKIVLRIPI